jgi:uncharacterized protein (UPF0305 family)
VILDVVCCNIAEGAALYSTLLSNISTWVFITIFVYWIRRQLLASFIKQLELKDEIITSIFENFPDSVLLIDEKKFTEKDDKNNTKDSEDHKSNMTDKYELVYHNKLFQDVFNTDNK